MHRYLRNINAPQNDVRWLWNHAEPLHYSECPLYSILSHQGKEGEAPWWREHLVKIAVGVFLAIVGGVVTWIVD